MSHFTAIFGDDLAELFSAADILRTTARYTNDSGGLVYIETGTLLDSLAKMAVVIHLLRDEISTKER